MKKNLINLSLFYHFKITFYGNKVGNLTDLTHEMSGFVKNYEFTQGVCKLFGLNCKITLDLILIVHVALNLFFFFKEKKKSFSGKLTGAFHCFLL